MTVFYNRLVLMLQQKRNWFFCKFILIVFMDKTKLHTSDTATELLNKLIIVLPLCTHSYYKFINNSMENIVCAFCSTRLYSQVVYKSICYKFVYWSSSSTHSQLNHNFWAGFDKFCANFSILIPQDNGNGVWRWLAW